MKKACPKDALHLFLGAGELGHAIILNQPFDLVAFTGSLKTAKEIHKSLSLKSGKIIPLIAETGGLNAMIVDSSALLERACDDIIRSAFNSAGQRCSALRLLLVHQEVYKELLTMLKGAMDDLRVGVPNELCTDVGPIITNEALDKLNNYLAKLQADGNSFFNLPELLLPKIIHGFPQP